MNLLIFCSDSHDGRILGSQGYPGAVTPHMDRLAAEGVTFSQAYCSSPQCVPSRASFWSGRQVHDIPAWNNYTGLREEEDTFFDVLTEGGYQCESFGKTDYLGGRHAEQNRLAAWIRTRGLGLIEKPGPSFRLDPDREPRSEQMARHWSRVDEACGWLRDRKETSPFCCFLGVNPPHPGGGYRTNRSWYDRIDPESVSPSSPEPSAHPAMRYMRHTKGAGRDFSRQEARDIMHAYLARIAEVDAMLGQVLDTLEDLSLMEETMVIYLSDHGDLHLEHGQHLKNALFEGSVRVPWIVRHPQGVRQHVETTCVSLLDFMPTVLDALGQPVPEHLPGRSLMPAVHGKAVDEITVFTEYHSNFQNCSSFMIRSGNWKLLHFTGYPPLLFNLKEDPEESQDQSSTHPDILKQMQQQLQTVCDPERISQAALEMDRLQLGHWMEKRGGFPEWRTSFRELFPDATVEGMEILEEWVREPDS